MVKYYDYEYTYKVYVIVGRTKKISSYYNKLMTTEKFYELSEKNLEYFDLNSEEDITNDKMHTEKYILFDM